ncbi:MAG: iron ABC transporter permease [Armatimonadota bacterium]|nr:iron ABC transporter permease [bacterium]MDW8321358.1 iron ABC transporter permease [Armatimonadota bacterium]
MPARSRTRYTAVGVLLFALAVATAVAALCLGSELFLPQQVWRILQGGSASSDSAGVIVWQLRLPRMTMAAMVGVLLSVAGVILQGLLRNDLADPYTIGVSSGAAMGASAAVLAGWEAKWHGFGVPLAAFVCAVAATVVVLVVARREGVLRVSVFLLAGIVVGSFMWSVVTLMLTLAGADVGRVLFWLMGSFADAEWMRVRLLLPFLVLAIVGLRAMAYGLNAFALGEESAAHLGFDVEVLKRAAIVLAALCTAAAVSVSGIIGFVGLVVPHIARRLFGADHRQLFWSAAVLGAVLMVWADTLARSIVRPAEIPVGVITALLGAPFFIALLRRERLV